MAWTNYSNSGPFVNNAAPGIGATFLNNIENFLDQIKSPAAADANVTADGAGNLIAVSLKGVLTSKGGGHTLTDWNFGFATTSSNQVTITHGIKNASGVATPPTAVFVCADYGASGPVVTAGTVGATTFIAYSSSAITNLWWVALLA